MRIPESEQYRMTNNFSKFTYMGPPIKVEEPFMSIFTPSIKSDRTNSDMSLQVCHCGWSKCTSYHGLRTHQGMMGCTPKGMRIPEDELYKWRDPWDKSHQEDSGPIYSTPLKKENEPMSPNLTTPMSPTAGVIEMMKSVLENQYSWQTTINSDRSLPALEFSTGAQQPVPMPVFQTLSTQANPAATEVKVKDTNQSLFGTPQRSHQTATNLDKVQDFSTGAQQPVPMPVFQTLSTQANPAATEVKVKDTNQSLFGTPQRSHQTATNLDKVQDFSTGAQQPVPMPVFQTLSTQANPAATEVKVKDTNQSLFGTPQRSHQTATNLDKVQDFSTGAQQPVPMPVFQTLSTQANPAATEVKVKDTNQSLFGTPQRSHQTATNLDKVQDFSTGAQQPVPMPVFQTLSTQANPAATEVKVKDTNQSLFGTPQRSHQTATNLDKVQDFSTGAQQTVPMPVFQTLSTQANPAATEVKVKDTNQSLFGTPQRSHQTTTNLDKVQDFSTGVHQTVLMPVFQTLSTQANPAATEVKVKDTNQSLFGTPQRSHQTTTNLDKVQDFSTGVHQTVLMPMFQTLSTQANPAATEVKVKDTNQSLFGTPEHFHPTVTKARRALDFSSGAQQVGQLSWDLPTTTAEKERQKELEKERQKEMEKEREKYLEKEREQEREKEREAQKLIKAKQDRIKADLQQKIQMTEQKISEVRSSVVASKGSLDIEWLEINSVFSEVIRVVEDIRQEALQPLEERRNRIKKESQDLVQTLQKEIDKLKKNIDELDKNPNLQVSPLTGLDNSRDWKNVTVDSSFSLGTLKSKTSKMMGQIQQELDKLSSVELKRISTFAVDVKLDPATAHRCLVLSPDGKKVTDGGKNQAVFDSPKRFDMFGSILGLNGQTTGKSYWEVEVGNKTGWDLGVVRRNANRKGKISLTPDNGYWVTVHYEDDKYAALSAPPVSLSLTAKPQKVGVFLDYEEGLVSFYDVTAQSHIYSFTECLFTGEILPYFSPHLKQNGKNSDPLIISAVKKQK